MFDDRDMLRVKNSLIFLAENYIYFFVLKNNLETHLEADVCGLRLLVGKSQNTQGKNVCQATTGTTSLVSPPSYSDESYNIYVVISIA